DVDQPFAELFLEPREFAGADGVIADDNDSVVFSGQQRQLVGERFSIVVGLFGLLGGCCTAHTSSSSATCTSSAEGTLWCHATSSSMNEMPLPLTVCATTATGMPLVEGLKAEMSCWKSWPSTSRTSQPNASSRRFSGSRVFVDSVLAPCCRRLRS